MLGGEGGPGRRGRSYGPSARSYGKAKAVISTRPKKHPGVALRAGAPKERSKNGGVSLARRAAAAPPSSSCGQHRRPRHWPQRIPERARRRSRFPKCTNPIIPWGVVTSEMGAAALPRGFNEGGGPIAAAKGRQKRPSKRLHCPGVDARTNREHCAGAVLGAACCGKA